MGVLTEIQHYFHSNLHKVRDAINANNAVNNAVQVVVGCKCHQGLRRALRLSKAATRQFAAFCYDEFLFVIAVCFT